MATLDTPTLGDVGGLISFLSGSFISSFKMLKFEVLKKKYKKEIQQQQTQDSTDRFSSL